MLYTPQTEFPLTERACREATGQTLAEWYAWLDAGGKHPGRRELIFRMYVGRKLPVWWAITIAVEYEKHCGMRKKDGLYEGYGICASKQLAAPVSRLYAAWAAAEELSRWFGAGTQATVVDGGTYSNDDGDRGKYLRVRPQRDLRLSWENPALATPTLVDVAFSDKGDGKSQVMVNHSRIQLREEADGLRMAWQDALGKLKTLLEAGM
jgi:uncharacterized protein YndB with AHSA1/START domain